MEIYLLLFFLFMAIEPVQAIPTEEEDLRIDYDVYLIKGHDVPPFDQRPLFAFVYFPHGEEPTHKKVKGLLSHVGRGQVMFDQFMLLDTVKMMPLPPGDKVPTVMTRVARLSDQNAALIFPLIV